MTFVNPIPVGVILQPVDQGILTIRRGIPPHIGGLALPGGFMEAGETWQNATARELVEETGLTIDPDALQEFWIVSAPNDVLLVFCTAPKITRSQVPEFKPNSEVTELVVVDSAVELAFPLHTQALARWFQHSK
jgi:ADP-ribose pyrophosphatase YjhB (NUDIX family)